MFYPWYEWSRGFWAPMLDLTAQTPTPAQLMVPLQLAAEDMVRRFVRAGEPVVDDLGAFVRSDVGGPFDATSRDLDPFATLWRFRGPRGGGAPVVLVPPCSGYACGVISPLIVAMLKHRPVLALDWRDARMVPRAAGRFGLAEQTAAVERAVAEAGPGAVVVGLSQSVTAAVAGAALAASRGKRPGALVLLAGPFDTRDGNEPLSVFLRHQPPRLLEAQYTTTVPQRYPGAGRRVYPGLLQLVAYACGNVLSYWEAHAGLVGELLAGEPGDRAREHRDLHCLADVPAELFLDTVEVVYRAHALARDELTLGARRVPLRALDGIQLLTVEMTADVFVGAGQVHAAVDLLPHAGARRVTVEGGRHHEVFTGERFFNAVVPHLDQLLDAA